ncbi:MAG: hypothetical protein VB031_03065 [Eubacteriaceae bacterium]|nr:hypothetical protein [Eubacteriaceae bacterium]
MKKRKLILCTVLAMIMAVTMTIPAVASAGTAGIKESVKKTETKSDAGQMTQEKSAVKTGVKANVSVAANGPGVIYVVGTAGTSVSSNIPGYTTVYINSSGFKTVPVATAGTYTVNNVTSAIFMSSVNRTIASGGTYYVGNMDNAANIMTFKADKTGYVAVSAAPYGGYVSLYAGSKALSGKDYLSNGVTSSASKWMNAVCYGVKKGKTYSFRMSPSYLPVYWYAITYQSKAIKEKSGSKKSKAKTIKRKKNRYGAIAAGSGTKDWYKIKTSKKKLTIRATAGTNDRIKVKLYHKRGRTSVSRTLTLSRAYGYTYTAKGNAVKGTWYAKVERANSKSSGAYKLYWK